MNCPHCDRDLEEPVELTTGFCTSDDCPRHDRQTAREAVIDRFLTDCRQIRAQALGGFATRVRISQTVRSYRVPLSEADLTLTRDDAVLVLRDAYGEHFGASI